MNIAVVTGASSGVGREFVHQLAGKYGIQQIWAIARGEEKLSKLKSGTDFDIRTFSVDVSDRSAVAAFARSYYDENVNVVCLVNCAGYGKFCAYDELDTAESLKMIDTDVCGVVAVTLETLPYMDKGARIINIASAAAFQPLPYINLYGSSKAFVRNYSRALNRELRPRGISVTCVCPYWVNTNFFSVAHEHRGNAVVTKYEVMYEPQDIVSKAMHDADNRRDMSAYGFVNKLQHLCAKLLPQSVIMSAWQKRHGLYR